MGEDEPRLPAPAGTGLLLAAARRGKSEDWVFIDREIADNPDNPDYLSWASLGLSAPTPDVRDLAATIYEQASTEALLKLTGERQQPREILGRLRVAMFDKTSDLAFMAARFRAASAWIKHGGSSEEAKGIVKEAIRSDDAELAQAAQDRLAQIEEMERARNGQNPNT